MKESTLGQKLIRGMQEALEHSKSNHMKIGFIRLYTGNDGRSHFEEMIMNLSETPFGNLAAPFAAQSLVFGEAGHIQEVTWHNPPSPCFIIMLEGGMEIEVGDGTKKIFKEGDILLVEDMNGQGHITRPNGQSKGRYLMVTLEK